MTQLFVLFEHASGYALFKAIEFEEVSVFVPQVKQSIKDVSKFRSVVKLISFQPFKTGQNALENVNSLSESLLHPHLQLFLETNVPKSQKKKQPVVLGVADPKLGAIITETLAITCTHIGAVPEILRGIRHHFTSLVKGFKNVDAALKAQLGLGHHYSRAKVKFNVNKVDNMVIQSISVLDQLDKDINTFSMRVREWYSHHFPELIKVVTENATYVKCVGIIQSRKNMPEDVAEQLLNVLSDPTKVQNVLAVARSSMGMEISTLDMENVISFAERINSLVQRRKELVQYLRVKMQNIAPNLAVLIGDMVGARLISQAGSLTNLAKYPASTVQILGAEKALFRALKTKGNTPKYGLLFHSSFIGKASKENKGRISRYLANKCSLASRIDCFSDIPTDVFGERLRRQVEDRLLFYDTGALPKKNVDVMTEAAEEAEAITAVLSKKMKKEAKKARKRKLLEMQAMTESMINSSHGSSFFDATSDAEAITAVLSKKMKKEAKKARKRKLLEMQAMTESMINSSHGSSFFDATSDVGFPLLKDLC